MKTSYQLALGVTVAFSAPIVLAVTKLRAGVLRVGLPEALLFAALVVLGSCFAFHAIYREVRSGKRKEQ